MTIKILDFGCGKGCFSNYLSVRYPESILYGVDISKKNISFAEKRKKSENQHFIVIEKEKKLNFKDNYFHIIYINEVLEHVGNPDIVLSEIKRVLCTKGLLYITTPLKDSEQLLAQQNKDYLNQVNHLRTFDKKELAEKIEHYGFKIKSHITYNAIEHLYWRQLFKKGISIIDETGDINKILPLYLKILMVLFNQDSSYIFYNKKNLFNKLLFGITRVSYPISRLIDKLFINKKQRLIATLEK